MNRDYYYSIDTMGSLTLDGVVQDDPWFVDFFFRRLAPNANPHCPDYPFVSRCGDEMNYLKPHDTPIVYTGYDGVRLYYANSLNVLFHADRLSYSSDGVLYHSATVGERGRLVPNVAMEVARNIRPWGPWYAFNDTTRQRVIPILPTNSSERFAVIRPREDNACIACGEANPNSLFMSFVLDRISGQVCTYVQPDHRMEGSLGTVHGGFVSLLLDETMGKCLSARALRAPTAQLNVRFRQPMMVGVDYKITAWVASQAGRKNFLKAQIHSTSNPSLLIAEADALFITIASA